MKLISSPAKAWEEISMEKDSQKVFITFVYPMIGLCGLSVFIGSLLTNGWGGPESFQVAMTSCCAVAVALFGGYFLAAYAINEMGTRMFGMSANLSLAQQFAGYALVVPFLLQIVTGLLPDFRIIAWLLQFYIVYVVWEGAPIMMRVGEKQRLKYTLLLSVLLILCPAVIQFVFNKLTAILN
ncbi:Yip1 family protein [Bacteroides sp.]|uniref:Yip1 family protein n=1 Tax=Bacteroides sp. TaxID=29523 RepID=UPI00262B3E6F|nr:Yip1 family protein [Bacteroides sp.]MDD3037491.1 Yip1 family protein [Bacteroides sp.]